MKRISLGFALASVLALRGAQAQEQVPLAPAPFFFAQQAPPVPPAPPTPAIAPVAPFGDAIRWMSASGSYLGVGVRDVTEERKKALNLKEERGAEVTSVEDDSPAFKAGLKTGDVVLEYNAQRIEGMEQFIRMVRETPPGREVKILVSRGGSSTTLTARPETVASRAEKGIRMLRVPMGETRAWTMETMPRPAMNWQSTSLGVEAESLDEQLASFFGVKQGVLIRSVARGSVAEKSGIKAGDVIVKVEDGEVKTPRDVSNSLRSARSKNKTVALSIVRERKEQPLKVTFDDEAPAARPVPPRVRSVQNKELEF